MAGDADKEYTAGGNMSDPVRHNLAWVLKTWNKLDAERVKNSLKVCVFLTNRSSRPTWAVPLEALLFTPL